MDLSNLPVSQETIEQTKYTLLMVVVTVILIGSVFVLLGATSNTASNAIVIEDTSEEGQYYTQVSPRPNIIQGTVDTTTSVYVSLEESSNIDTVTVESGSLQQNELYANPAYDADSSSTQVDSIEALSSGERSSQIVRISVEDPDRPAEIVLIAEPSDPEEREVINIVTVEPQTTHPIAFDVPDNKTSLFTVDELNELNQ